MTGNAVAVFICTLSAIVSFASAFVPTHRLGSQSTKVSHAPQQIRPFRSHPLYAKHGEDDSEEDDEDIDLSDQDWRAFRAKLVMSSTSGTKSDSKRSKKSPVIEQQGDLDGIGSLFSEPETTIEGEEIAAEEEEDELLQGMTPLDPSQWAYDSGKVIEQGAIILGGVEQDYGFGLRQQYFHKAAILVLDHQESTFTKGIILNRPSDLMLEDDVNKGVKWRVWFGGDVQGINSVNPDIVCLHSITNNDLVNNASIPVMKDIQWTSFDAAKRLVKAGVAHPSDFWVFCGYAGWGPGQLMGELDRKSWYMVATDSQTLLKELARQAAGSDPRDAGLDTWTLLMHMIGRKETASQHTGDFDDLMLKEWALKNLLSTEAGGGAGEASRLYDGGMVATKQQLRNIMMKLTGASGTKKSSDSGIKVGSLVRASGDDRSPFLLEDQELHKSVVLVISDDDNVSVGVILNRPAAKGLDIQITDKDSGKTKTIKVPLRYGGQYSVKGSEPLLWLHCKPVLKAAEIGSPLGETEGIWKCTANDVVSAVSQGLATPEEFLVVAGVSVWTKTGDMSEGVQGLVQDGKFEVIPKFKARAVWDTLLKQEVLSADTLAKNLQIADEAWFKGQTNGKIKRRSRKKTAMKEEEEDGEAEKKENGEEPPPIAGLGEGFDEEDDSLVFKSDVKVSDLSDDALKSWVATFLLGAPSGLIGE
jgi:putative AlgH/UPF0301 family transcriptional regulator